MRDCIRQKDETNNLILKYDLQFFAKDGEGGEKTEPATAKKLKDAREEGKVAKSKELTAAFDLIVLFLVLKVFISFVGKGMLGLFPSIYAKIPEFIKINASGLSSHAVSVFLTEMILKWLEIAAPFFVCGVVITILISIIQVGWKISTKPMQPKLSKMNPLNGFKRIFSKDSLFELLKSVVKIVLIVYIAYTSIKNHRNQLFILYDLSLNQAVCLVGEIIIDTGLKISIVYLVVGIADYVFQKRKFNEDMKMTKQEVKDEFKNTEGDPQSKDSSEEECRKHRREE